MWEIPPAALNSAPIKATQLLETGFTAPVSYPRTSIAGTNSASSSEFSAGVGYCACGRRLSVHTNAGRAGRRPQYHYVCSHRRRHGSGACPQAKFHKAEEIEGRVREFVYRLLHDPEALRRQTLRQLERDRASLGRVEEEAGVLEEQIAEADRERDGYLRLAARSRISEGELDHYLAELEQRKEGARKELEGLRDRRRRLSELDELAREVDEYLADLPYLVDREPVVRDYETVPPEPDDGGRLPIYELVPQHIRRRSDQEVAELRERRERRERAERYRDVYRLLTLRVVAHRDGTLEASGTFGGQSLTPGEPRALEPPPFDYPAHVLSSSSDSHR